MKVDYMNCEFTDSVARVTFIGSDPSTKKRRRPMIELDEADFAQLIATAGNYRAHQLALAEKHMARADAITTSLKDQTT